jgi:hypothetical protein
MFFYYKTDSLEGFAGQKSIKNRILQNLRSIKSKVSKKNDILKPIISLIFLTAQ